MFTDMVGSTALAQRNEAEALRLRDEQEVLVRPRFAAHQGREIKSMGDGFLAEFDSALRAVQCAIDVQERLHDRNSQPGARPIQLRIGVHLGDVERHNNDIFGDAVNIASRIEPLASPGGICISGEVFSQVRNKIPNRLEKLPAASLKGIHVSVDLYRVVLPWAGGPPVATDHAPAGLGILPFKNISPDPKDGYIAEGLTEELISVISQVRGLRVISRTSVMQYLATTKSVSQIAAELGVGSILEGSVRKAGNRLRITAQLIDAPSDRHLWTQLYDRDLDDVFAVQTEIAKQVAAALEVELRPAEQSRLDSRRSVRPESYLAYLKGRTLIHYSATKATLQAAKEQFELSISLDSSNAAAYSSLSEITLMIGWFYADVPPAEWIRAGRSLVAKAIELDPNLAEAHAALALALWNDFDYPTAEKEFRLALSLNPSDSEVHNSYALLLEDEGRTDEALVELLLAEEADPRWPRGLGNLAHLLIWLRRLDEALTKVQKFGEVKPDSLTYHNLLSVYYLAKADLPRALEEIGRCEELETEPRWKPLNRAWRYALSGDTERSRATLRAEESLPDRPETADSIAQIYVEIGDMDQAYRWLAKAIATQNVSIRAWRLDPRLEPARADPRFLAALRSMHLA